jgi:hypothetical protein
LPLLIGVELAPEELVVVEPPELELLLPVQVLIGVAPPHGLVVVVVVAPPYGLVVLVLVAPPHGLVVLVLVAPPHGLVELGTT